MSKIIRAGKWDDHDELDGAEFRSGDRLRITWPDGVVEEVEVCVEIDLELPTGRCYAHAKVKRHGAYALVPLTGHEAEWIDVPNRGSR